MTIKQQGGIFGRNPTFNDLTVEGTLTTSGATETSGDLTLNDSKLNITANRPQIFLKEQDRANNNVRLECQNDNFNIAYVDDDNLNNVTRFFVEMNTGNAEIVNGNLVIGTSGNGIDFSATSGTGTSELFSDYEEGVFTPTLTTDATDFSSVTYDAAVFGSYTKVGNVVHIQLFMQTDAVTKGSASGNVIIGGLPFTADGTSPLAVATSKDWLADHPTRAYVADGATTISLLTNANNTADDENVVVADVKTLGNDNTLRLSGTYRAS